MTDKVVEDLKCCISVLRSKYRVAKNHGFAIQYGAGSSAQEVVQVTERIASLRDEYQEVMDELSRAIRYGGERDYA